MGKNEYNIMKLKKKRKNIVLKRIIDVVISGIGFDELVKLIKRGYEFIKSSNCLTISD